MYDVTRDVVSDLWPLYRDGDASQDSRKLVEAFLGADPGFSGVLQAGDRRERVMPPVRFSPDAERRLLDAARARARLRLLVIGGGIALAALILIAALGGLLFMMGRGL